jgi:hypothetical protein
MKRGPSLLSRLWQDRRWRTAVWLVGTVAGAVWVYSGMPMICH